MHTANEKPSLIAQSLSQASYADRNAAFWKRNLVICVFGSFTTLVSLSMLLPFLPLYVEQLGVTSPSAISHRPVVRRSIRRNLLRHGDYRTSLGAIG